MDYKLFCILLLFFSFQLSAQNFTESIRETAKYNKSFSQTSFNFSLIDNNGIVWIATHMGLFKYDGQIIKPVVNKEYPAINSNRIVKFGRDFLTGDIVFVTYPENCLYIITNNIIKRIESLDYKKQYLFTSYYECLLPNTQFYKSVINYIHQKVKELNYDAEAEIKLIKLNNDFYFLINNIIIVYNENEKPYTIKLPNYPKYELLRFNENIILLSKSKAFLLENNKIKPIKADSRILSLMNQNNDPLKKNIFCDKDIYYISYDEAIYQIKYLNNSLSTKFIDKNEDNSPFFLIRDVENDLFFLKKFTSDFTIIKPKYFNVLAVDDSEKNNCYAIAKIDDNNWYSASGWTYNTKSKKLKSIANTFYNKGVIIPFNNTFYVTDKNRLYDVRNSNVSIEKPFGTISGYTYFRNKLWIPQDNYLLHEHNKSLTVDLFFKERTKDFNIIGIHSYKDNIIVLTDKGVYLYKPNISLIPISGLDSIYARYFKPIDKDNFWIGTYGNGLFLNYKNKVYKVKDLNNDLVSTHAIEEDQNGNLWISTNTALLTISKNEAISKILKNQTISFYRFFKQDGLPTNEFNGGGTHPSLNDKNGIIGFPSVRGFVWFDTKVIKKYPFRRTILIEKISIDGKEMNVENNSGLNVSNESQFIDIEVNYAYYYNRDNLSFEYKYNDENKWQKIKNNSIQLRRKSNGKKKLLIRLHTHGFDSKHDIIKTFDINFEPKFHETIWFWILIISLFILFLIVSFRFGMYINKKKRMELDFIVRMKTLELEKSKEEISKSLVEKEILLKEIHHRVKNNLQLVISMMSIQLRRKNYKNIDEFMETSRRRITSMVMIHQTLYQGQSLTSIDMSEYINMLVSEISETFHTNKSIRATINTNATKLKLTTAIPFGLIINEILTNAFKHAFPNQKTGTISINLDQTDQDLYLLTVQDDGVGFDYEKQVKNSFGLDLISLLVKQLNGQLEINSVNGTKYTIEFQSIN